jgi:hypothetical protein
VSPFMKRHHRNHFYTSEFAKMVDWEGKFGLINAAAAAAAGR